MSTRVFPRITVCLLIVPPVKILASRVFNGVCSRVFSRPIAPAARAFLPRGDPFFDLAVIVEGHQLNESESLQLLQSYLQENPSKQDFSRLYSNRVIYSYLSVLWFAVKNASDASEITNQQCHQQLVALQQLISAMA